MLDCRRPLCGARLHGNPVAGDGVVPVHRFVGELPRQRRGQFTCVRRDLVETALLDDHARRNRALGGIGRKMLLKRVAPAKLFDQDENPCSEP